MVKKRTQLGFSDFIVEQIKTDTIVFTEEEIEDGYRRVRIVLPGEPLSKQSVRFIVSRYYQPGSHICSFCGTQVLHRAGDVVVYKNKNNGLSDVIVKTYQDSKYDKKKEEYLWMLKSKKVTFKAFQEEVHIERLHLVFHPLAATPKYKLNAMNAGHVFYKAVKGDLDNYFKFTFDFMTGFIYKDDAIIVSMNDVKKYYGSVPRIEIILKGK